MEDVAKQKISCAEQQLSRFVLKLYISLPSSAEQLCEITNIKWPENGNPEENYSCFHLELNAARIH